MFLLYVINRKEIEKINKDITKLVWRVIVGTVIASISVIMLNVTLIEERATITIWNVVISCSFVSITNAITLTIYVVSLL